MKRTDDQRQLAAAVRELADKHAGSLRKMITTPLGYDPVAWEDIVAMGLPGIAVDEEHGGAGGNTADLAVALEELGRRLLPSPLFASASLAVTLLREAGDESATARWLPGIVAGTLRATVALPRNTSLSVDVDGRLTGSLTRLVDGATADLVFALVDGSSGTRLYGIDTGAPGWATTEPPMPLDLTRRIATAHVEQVPAVPIDADPGAIGRALGISRTLLAAEQIGGAQRCLDMAIEHAKGRNQFGRPIGTFQAIKHLCADTYSDIECARALLGDALSGGGIAGAAVAAYASEAFVRAAERNMQIHGGISYTWEHDCHLYLRRARSSERLLGSVRDAYDDIAQSLLPL